MTIDFSAASRDFTEALVANPYYAIDFDPGLFGAHRASVTEEQWIAANRKLLAAVGDERYLRLLLDVLKGVDPVTTHEPELAEIIRMLDAQPEPGSAKP